MRKVLMSLGFLLLSVQAFAVDYSCSLEVKDLKKGVTEERADITITPGSKVRLYDLKKLNVSARVSMKALDKDSAFWSGHGGMMVSIFNSKEEIQIQLNNTFKIDVGSFEHQARSMTHFIRLHCDETGPIVL